MLRFFVMHPDKILRSILLGLAGACALGACNRAALPQAAAQASQPAPAPASAAAKPLSTTAKLPAPETLADTFITGQVKAALMTDPSLAGADVSVNTSRGVVSLTGRVKNREQAAIASAHAEGEDGVMRVENTLLVSAD
ncbi:MAG TPA: BON domain-containing protein [Usitatibacter sp.]|nr:BON domain-containing protein [Usitatibacter sp.]